MPLGSAEASVSVGLATAGIVYGVYNMSLPTIADVRNTEQGNADIRKSERTAAWVSALAVTGIALITSDPTVFVVGGAAMVAIAWLYRHADQVDPLSGSVVPKPLRLVPGGISDEPVAEDGVFVAD
jgi:hypothetical protein